MDVKDKKFINRLFDKAFYNDNSKFKRKEMGKDSEEFSCEDREVIDSFVGDKRGFEEY